MRVRRAKTVQGIGSPGDGVDFDSTWDTLSASLNDIRAKNASALSFEQLYRNAYKLVLKKQGEELYNRVQELERTWLQGHVKPRLLTAVASSLSDTSGDGSNLVEKRAAGERLMGALKQAWEDHILCMNMTTDVLMYLVGDKSISCTLYNSNASSTRTESTATRITALSSFKLPWHNSATIFSTPESPHPKIRGYVTSLSG